MELHGALWSSVEHCGAPSRALKHWSVWSEFFLIGLCGVVFSSVGGRGVVGEKVVDDHEVRDNEPHASS